VNAAAATIAAVHPELMSSKFIDKPETAAIIFMRSPRIPKVLFCAVDPFSHIWAPLDSSLSSSSDKLSIPLTADSSVYDIIDNR
jgi:hypothetical protein